MELSLAHGYQLIQLWYQHLQYLLQPSPLSNCLPFTTRCPIPHQNTIQDFKAANIRLLEQFTSGHIASSRPVVSSQYLYEITDNS